MTNPKITLGGKEYEIPKLAIKQNRHVELLVTRNKDFFLQVKEKGRMSVFDLTDQQAEDFTKVVYHALTRAHPELTFEQFEELPISMTDIIAALTICIDQSGLYKRQPDAPEEAPQSGEVMPGNPG